MLVKSDDDIVRRVTAFVVAHLDERVTLDAIALKRPGTGLPPAMRPCLIGRKARTDIQAGTLLSLDLVA